MRKKGKSSIKAAARRAAKAATPPKKRKDSVAPGSSRTRYVRDFDGQVFEFVDLNYPPPLTGDPPQLAWPRIHMGMWPDPNLTHWPTEDIVQRLATFNLHAEPEMFRRLVEEYRSGDAVLKNWPTPELERGDAWDDFPVWAMQALLRRWAADIPNIDVLGEKLRDSPDELWTGEDLDEGAEFLLGWLQEAVQLLEVVPASQRADVWKGLQGAADTDLDVFLPNWWDTLAQRDPEALLALRPVLSEVLVDPGELLTTLVRTLAQQGRREDLQPLIGELCDGMGTHFPLDVAVALRTLVITGFEEESLQVARALFPRADDPLSWQTAADVLGLHLPAEEWEELAAQHPQPEVEEMDLDPDAIAELAELTDEYEDFDEETDPEFDEDLWHRAKADVLSDLTPSSPSFPQPESNPFRGVGRNDPCPCGSGKKFKMCHQRSG